MTEPLESRVLLAASFAAGKLTVIGTAGDDRIVLDLVDGQVRVNETGVEARFFRGVKSIDIEAGGGRDRVIVVVGITAPTRIVGGSGHDSLTGGNGPDVIIGGNGNDILDGNAGNDALLGGNDSDTLDGSFGDDYLDGQAGVDTVTYYSRTQSITAGLTGYNDGFVRGRGGEAGENDTIRDTEHLIGGKGNDAFYGDNDRYTDPPDSLGGTPSYVHSIRGGPGNDSFLFSGNVEHAEWYGEEGNDTFSVGKDDDATYALISGGPGIDWQIIESEWIKISEYGNALAPDVENAEVFGAHQTFTGNDLNNTIIIHSPTIYQVFAGAGNDRVITAGTGDTQQIVYGGDGNDTLEGGHAGGVKLVGEAGDDLLKGGRYADILDGGIGNDALFGNGDKDALLGGDGNDYLEGGEGDDCMAGNAGNDTLRGGAGADRMEGNNGNDTFYSRDKLKDILYGGSGTDSAQRDASEQIIDSIENTLA